MKIVKRLNQQELLEKGIDALSKELGPVEARRFMALTHPVQHEDCVKRHHRWQASLSKDEYLAQIRTAHGAVSKNK